MTRIMMTKPLLESPLSEEMTKAKRGRPTGDRDKKREELLDVAITTLAHEGYSGLSIRKVAQNAGGSTGTITYYFANKDELILGIADELFKRFEAILVSEGEPTDIATAIEQWSLWSSADNTDLVRAFLQLQSYATIEPTFADFVQKRNELILSQLIKMIEKGQQANFVRNDIPADILAEQLSAMGDGFMISLSIHPNRLSSEKINALQQCIKTLISPT